MNTYIMNQYLENDTADLVEELNDRMTQAVMPVTIFVGIECAFGFFGNLLVIYAFLFHYKVCTFKYFVVCLAIIDITCCLSTMPGEMVTQLYWYVYPASIRGVCKVKSFLNVFTVSAEALCLLTIAIDRYRKVCRPFGWQIKPRVAKYICGLLYVLAFIIALPTPFLWGLRSQKKQYQNSTITVTHCEKDGRFEKTNYPIYYISTVMAIVTLFLILMLIHYVFVAMKLMKERRHRLGSCTKKASTLTPSCTQSDRHQTSMVDSSEFVERPGEVPISKCENSDIPCNNRVIHNSSSQNNLNALKIQSRNRKSMNSRVRRKTLIMFILTFTFVITTIIYFVLVTIIASPKDILQQLTDGQKAVYFFFLRFYFINHVINPFVYGLLDPQFKVAMKNTKRSISKRFR